MSIIAINISRLSISERIVKGNEVVAMSTDNANVPGNAPLLASLTAAITALETANGTYEEGRQGLKGLLAARDGALGAFNGAMASLAAFTESVTGGDAEKILTTGFDVRSEPTPPQPVAQVENVKVSFNGEPGKSIVTWKRESNADAYRIQCSPEPITEHSWKEMGTVTEAKFEGNGATPGQKCWYRAAGVNRFGQGPWSEPALRPVM
jgi:hypothetical protein